MSLNKEAYIRYKIIDECLTNRFSQYPSIDYIIEQCEEKLGKKFSKSSIQKDMKAMKEDELLGFLAPIKFSRIHYGYYYQDESYSINRVPLNSSELESLEAVSDVLNTFAGSRISENYDIAVRKIFTSIKEKKQQFEKKQRIIQTDSHVNHKGFENFELFYHAISNHIPVCFVHYSYAKRCFNSIISHPYVLKEFQNKWYVLAYSKQHREIRTFGLDRILDPILIKTEFRKADDEKTDNYYTDIYGVYPLKGFKKQKVCFKCDSLLSEYLKANPIHESQRITDIEPYGSIHFELNLIPSQELINYFIEFSPYINVYKPESIFDIISKSVNKASLKYRSKDEH